MVFRSTPASSPPTAPGPKLLRPQRNNSRTLHRTHAENRGPRRVGPLPRDGHACARPGRDDRHRPAHLRRRRHPDHRPVIFCVVGGACADRRHIGGNPDHPSPTRPAVNGFRGRAAGGRPGTRPWRGAAADADRRGRPGGRAHRDRAAGLRAESDARSYRGRVVRPARERDPGAPVRRRREPRTAHAARGDPRLYRTGATQARAMCPTMSPTR